MKGNTLLAANAKSDGTSTVMVCTVESDEVLAGKGGCGFHENISKCIRGIGNYNTLTITMSNCFKGISELNVDVDVLGQQIKTVGSTEG